MLLAATVALAAPVGERVVTSLDAGWAMRRGEASPAQLASDDLTGGRR